MNLNKFIYKYQYKLYAITFLITLLLISFKLASQIVIAIYFIFSVGFIFIISFEEETHFNYIYNRKIDTFNEIHEREPNKEEEEKIFQATRKQYYEE